MKVKLEGIFPAMLTPFTKGGVHVDYEKACAFAEWLAKKGVHGLYVCGTTGEGMLLHPEERKILLEEIVSAVGKKLKVVAHTGCLDTATTIELTVHALDAGAVAAGVIAPGYYRYDDAALIAHYKMVARAVKGGPVLLYDLPAFTGNALSEELVLELANSVDNIVGMKESHRDIAAFSRLVDKAPPGFALINGADEYTYQVYLTGAHASVSGTANVVPELFVGIYTNVQKGNLKKARALQAKLSVACELFKYGRLLASYKEGLRVRGLDLGYVRPPQRELSAKEKRAFSKTLEEAKVF